MHRHPVLTKHEKKELHNKTNDGFHNHKKTLR